MKQTKTLKNFEIVDILNKLSEPDSLINSSSPDKKLPISILWKINGNVKVLKEILTRIQEEEQKINDEYFNNDDKSFVNDEGLKEIKFEYKDEFISKKNELFSIENEIEISMINLNDLIGVNFIPADFQSIEFMIAEDE